MSSSQELLAELLLDICDNVDEVRAFARQLKTGSVDNSYALPSRPSMAAMVSGQLTLMSLLATVLCKRDHVDGHVCGEFEKRHAKHLMEKAVYFAQRDIEEERAKNPKPDTGDLH